MGCADFLDAQTHRYCHRFHVHSDKGVADVQSGVCPDGLHQHRVLEAAVGTGGKASAGLWLGDGVDDIQT